MGVLMIISRMPLNVKEKAFGLNLAEGRDITVAHGIGASNCVFGATTFWPCRDNTCGTFQGATCLSACSMVFQ
jgi:hypothetical protein